MTTIPINWCDPSIFSNSVRVFYMNELGFVFLFNTTILCHSSNFRMFNKVSSLVTTSKPKSKR